MIAFLWAAMIGRAALVRNIGVSIYRGNLGYTVRSTIASYLTIGRSRCTAVVHITLVVPTMMAGEQFLNTDPRHHQRFLQRKVAD